MAADPAPFISLALALIPSWTWRIYCAGVLDSWDSVELRCGQKSLALAAELGKCGKFGSEFRELPTGTLRELPFISEKDFLSE